MKRSLRYRVLTNLTFWVCAAIIAGVLLGHFSPVNGARMEIIGKAFISLIKLFIGPVIFLTIVLGIAGMGDLRRAGRIGLKALVYFETVTTFALIIGVVVAYLLQPGNIDKAGLPEHDHAKLASAATPFSWWQFFNSNFNLQVLVLAILCGIALTFLKQKQPVIEFLHKASLHVFAALRWVMYLAPLGAFGGIAYTVGKFGLHTMLPLAKLVGAVYLTMVLFVVCVLGLVMRLYRQNIFHFLRSIREELLLVLGTSSSETALPAIMRKLEAMGCSKSVVGLVIPTGYSFNLDGTSIYLSMAVIFLAQLYGVQLSFGAILSAIGILMITSKGAAGVTGSGFIVLASTLATLHSIPVEGLAFLLGVDKFMSEARAITNLIGNGVATIVIAKSEGEFVMPERAAHLEQIT